MDDQHLILFLNRLLANYFVIYVKLHRYKWHMKGKHTFMFQNLFAEMAENWKRDLDTLAEHILYIDGKPFATMVKFIKEATIEEATADDEEEEMVLQLIRDFTNIIDEVENIGIKNTLNVHDHFTYNMLLQLQTNIKKYRWKCKSYYQ